MNQTLETVADEEVKRQFREVLGEEWEAYIGSVVHTGEYRIQLVKGNLQFQFEFHISKLEVAKRMVKEDNALFTKYGIDWFIFRVKAKELL